MQAQSPIEAQGQWGLKKYKPCAYSRDNTVCTYGDWAIKPDDVCLYGSKIWDYVAISAWNTWNSDCLHRVRKEIAEVLAGEDYVSAEAVDKLEYLLQVEGLYFFPVLFQVKSSQVYSLTHMQVLQETLRLYPTVAGSSRQSSEDMTLGGFHITKGTQCSVSLKLIFLFCHRLVAWILIQIYTSTSILDKVDCEVKLVTSSALCAPS